MIASRTQKHKENKLNALKKKKKWLPGVSLRYDDQTNLNSIPSNAETEIKQPTYQHNILKLDTTIVAYWNILS
jgi:hypothetical protein